MQEEYLGFYIMMGGLVAFAIAVALVVWLQDRREKKLVA
jgi:hypothetical protein